MNTPQIDIGGQYSHCLHPSNFRHLPAPAKYGNLDTKWMLMVASMIFLNTKIKDVYQLHERWMGGDINPTSGTTYIFYLEEIAYWIRRNCDNLISLSYICERFKSFLRDQGELPSKIGIDCIAGLLSSPESHPLRRIYKSNESLLLKINNISNACKHSFVNSDLFVSGLHEPHLFAIALDRNNFNKEVVPEFISLSEVVSEFNKFLEVANLHLDSWPKPSEWRKHGID